MTIIGAGVVGSNAAAMAVGLGADVTEIDKDLGALRHLDERFGNRVRTLFATAHQLELSVLEADLVVGAVVVPGAAAPKLVTREAPTFEVEGVIHYCVANIPGAVARTSTLALNDATLPFVLALADKGIDRALRDDPHLLNGLNVAHGQLCRTEVAKAQGRAQVPPLVAIPGAAAG